MKKKIAAGLALVLAVYLAVDVWRLWSGRITLYSEAERITRGAPELSVGGTKLAYSARLNMTGVGLVPYKRKSDEGRELWVAGEIVNGQPSPAWLFLKKKEGVYDRYSIPKKGIGV